MQKSQRSSLGVAALLVLGSFALSCATSAHDHVPGVNRDLHGPPDIEKYIASLRDEARVHELRPAEVVKRLGLAPGTFIADLGCGPGVFTIPLARSVRSGVVFGVDVEPSQLDALRRRLDEEQLDNIVPVLASYSDPHLPPGRIDLCLVADTYHHIEDRPQYFARLRKDLTPGGRLALIEYKDGDLPVGPPPSRKVEKRVRHEELAAAGWELTDVFTFHTWHDFEVWSASKNTP